MSFAPQSFPNENYCLGAVSINQTPLDWKGNRERILSAAESLFYHQKNTPPPDLILFPELCVSGYGCGDLFHSSWLEKKAIEETKKIAELIFSKISSTAIVVVGLPFSFRGRLYNCSAVLSCGQIQAIIPKINLANDGIHYEKRWFSPFTENESYNIDMDGEMIPFGLLAFEHKGARLIIEICRDSWAISRPADLLLESDFDIILNPCASHFAFDKHILRRNIALESSRRLQAIFLSTNLLGCEEGHSIYDGQITAASCGLLLGESFGFSFDDFISASFLLDLSPPRLLRRKDPRSYSDIHHTRNLSKKEQNSLRMIHIDSEECPKHSHQYYDKTRSVLKSMYISNEHTKQLFTKDEESVSKDLQFLFAVSLGLFDYLRKSNNSCFILSLSGGMDSACCALLIHRMTSYGIAELGVESFCHRILGENKDSPLYQNLCAWKKEGLLSKDPRKKDHEETLSSNQEKIKNILQEFLPKIMPNLLYTLYQSTENSSAQTKKASFLTAQSVGSSHSEVDIQSQINLYKQDAEKILSSFLKSSSLKDISLQNIQARSRSPMIWLLANHLNGLLICTSNRSELSVGYTTMDGDSSGGLAPIAGVDKSFLRKWLLWLETEGDPLLGNLPQLKAVSSLKPSAELRPNQSDEEDLMPYRLLDSIQREAVCELKSPEMIFQLLKKQMKQQKQYHFTEPELQKHIKHFFTLFHASQWKRERTAPSFHLEKGSLNPAGWFRFPILSQVTE